MVMGKLFDDQYLLGRSNDQRDGLRPDGGHLDLDALSEQQLHHPCPGMPLQDVQRKNVANLALTSMNLHFTPLDFAWETERQPGKQLRAGI